MKMFIPLFFEHKSGNKTVSEMLFGFVQKKFFVLYNIADGEFEAKKVSAGDKFIVCW